ncbi:hypothetical protein, partial [Burkholderia sp. SIMBA_024]|uniref:hypothetical protein n=1 Tax=Burkholderia sp. SIMBA_024 TaxID=3085768 RepID=UPI00397C1299
QAMRQLSKEQFEAVYHQLVADLRVMVGAHVKYQPMYAGFPMQVMQADEAELYLNAIIHYLTHLNAVNPDQPSVDRIPLEKTDLKVIGL